jgi:hypothetical protein
MNRLWLAFLCCFCVPFLAQRERRRKHTLFLYCTFFYFFEMFNTVVTALGLFTVATDALPVRQGGDLYYEGATWNAKGVSAVPSFDSHDYYFEQRVDHFDRENTDTFQHRFV